MSVFEIPPALAVRSFTQETDLDGVTYRLTFRWNVREGYWYLDLSTTDDEVLLGGVKLVGGSSLFRYLVDDRRPTGIATVLGILTETNFGSDAKLVYADEDEINLVSA